MRSDCVLIIGFVLAVGGCQNSPTVNDEADPAAIEAEIKSTLQHLDPSDRLAVERQRFCAVMVNIRLGEMGPPQKIKIGDVTLFVCCDNCVRDAAENSQKVLKQLGNLKSADEVGTGDVRE